MKRILIIFAILLFAGSAWALQYRPGVYGYGTDSRFAYTESNDPIICIVDDLDENAVVDKTPSEYPTLTGGGVTVWTGGLDALIDEAPPANTGKIILFAVGGVINAGGYLNIANNSVAIHGETAPSPGITVRNGLINLRGDDIWISHIRSRQSDENYGVADNLKHGFELGHGEGNHSNLVLDHVSASWAPDTNANIYSYSYTVNNATISNSILSEGLNSVSGSNHGYACLIAENNTNVSLIGNLTAHNFGRNPLVSGGTTYIANNLDYNSARGHVWYRRSLSGDGVDLSIIGNLKLIGPNSSISPIYYGGMLEMFTDDYPAQSCDIFMPNHTADTANRIATWIDSAWSEAVIGDYGWDTVWDRPGTMEANCRDDDEGHSITPPSGFTPANTNTVYASVLANAGARPADRDATDTRIISEVVYRTGSIRSNDSGLPSGEQWSATTSSRNLETGMGTLGAIPSDPHAVQVSGYTALEEWLHSLATYYEGGPPPEPPDGNIFDNITFMWDMEALDFAASNGAANYSAGDEAATASSGAVIAAGAKKNGTYGLDCPTAEDLVIFISTDIVDTDSAATIGFWLNPRSIQVGGGIIKIFNTADTGEFNLSYAASDEITATWIDDDGNTDLSATSTTADLAENDEGGDSWQYIEVTFDQATGSSDGKVTVYVDNTAVITQTGLSLTAFTENRIYIGDSEGVASTDQWFDDIKITDTFDADLYSVRDEVDYSGDPGPSITDLTCENTTYTNANIGEYIDVCTLNLSEASQWSAITWTMNAGADIDCYLSTGQETSAASVMCGPLTMDMNTNLLTLKDASLTIGGYFEDSYGNALTSSVLPEITGSVVIDIVPTGDRGVGFN